MFNDHWRLLSFLPAIILVVSGCQPSKRVTITTDPSNADIFIERIKDGRAEPPESLGQGEVERSLQFPDGVSYRVTGKLYKYQNVSATILLEPEDRREYRLKLVQFLETIPTTIFEPKVVRNRPKTWKLESTQIVTEAYLDETEKNPLITRLSMLPASKDTPHLNFVSSAPTDDMLVYQNIMSAAPELIHTVSEKNETLESIAEKYEFTVAELRRMNGLTDPEISRLRIGDELKIAPPQLGATLWKQPTTGARFQPVTTEKRLNLFPTFTPNSDSVVFASNRISTNLALWRINVSGSNAAVGRITTSNAEDYRPSVGPDGRIAFTSLVIGAESPQVWTVRPDGSDLTQLPDGEYPQISPQDGRRIVFVRRHPSQPHAKQLWTMGLDGGDQRQLTQNLDYDIIDPKWSPDGRFIAYSSNEGKDPRSVRNYDIWIISSDGLRKTQVTRNGSWDDSPAWDRNGHGLYFRSNRGGQWRIWRADLDQEKLTASQTP